MQLERTREALSAFQSYLELSPQAKDREAVEERSAVFLSGGVAELIREAQQYTRIGQKQYYLCPGAGYNPIWSVAACEGRSIIFDPTLKNEESAQYRRWCWSLPVKPVNDP